MQRQQIWWLLALTQLSCSRLELVAARSESTAGNAGSAGRPPLGGGGDSATGGKHDGGASGGSAGGAEKPPVPCDSGCDWPKHSCIAAQCISAPPGLAIQAGASSSCSLTADGNLFCWGAPWIASPNGSVAQQPIPLRISPTARWSEISTHGGEPHCAVRSDGNLLCWGSNRTGALGTGDLDDRYAPIPSKLKQPVAHVAVGASHGCAITLTHEAYCWGDGSTGQLGQGELASSTTPLAVAGLKQLQAITVGTAHSCALTGNGTIYCWGSNHRGQLGTTSPASSSTPQRVPGGPFVALSAGGNSTCAIAPNKDAWCWGDNADGQLGVGDFDSRTAPTRVLGLRKWAWLDLGDFFVVGTTTDGALWQWGGVANSNGIPDQTDLVFPQRVEAGPGWVRAAAGDRHRCAARDNGQVACWGDNYSGQLGSGDFAPREQPTIVVFP